MNAALDPARLYVILDRTSLRSKDPNLYQLLYNLIGNLVNLKTTTTTSGSGSTTVTNITEQIINQIISDDSGGSGGDGLVIPGPPGPTGANGANGAPGAPGVNGITQLITLENSFEETFLNIGPAGPQGATGPAGVGGLVLLEEHTAAASASIDFTTAISSTYDDYLFELVNVLPVTSTANLFVEASTNGGVSYDTGANYVTAHFRWSKTGSAFSGSAADTNINLTASPGSAAVNGGINGSLALYNPLNAAAWKMFIGHMMYRETTTPEMIGAEIRGAYASITAVNAIRFIFSSGNIASGTIRCYGLSK